MYSEIDNIIIETKKRFFSNHHGEHLSFHLGNGLEFNEIKEYTLDDDIRHINWKITARTRKPNVNKYYDTKKLQIACLYLCSGSMNFGTTNLKKDVANQILSSLVYIGTRYKDNVFNFFLDKDIQMEFNNNYGKDLPYVVFETMKNFNHISEIDYKKVHKIMYEKIPIRSIVFIVGDFLDMPQFDGLSHLFEIYVFIIRDKKEEELDFSGECNIVDLNNQKIYNTNISSKTIEKYNDAMQAHDKKLFNYFTSLEIKYTKVYTEENPLEVLENFFKRIFYDK